MTIALSPLAQCRALLAEMPPQRRGVLIASLAFEAKTEARDSPRPLPVLPAEPHFGSPGFKLIRAAGDRRQQNGGYKRTAEHTARRAKKPAAELTADAEDSRKVRRALAAYEGATPAARRGLDRLMR
jgi:hypothetical protein